MNLIEYNSYKGCCCYDIQDIYINHIYFLITPSIGKEECKAYDPKNLLLHIYKQFKDHIHQLNRASISKKKE